jgi:hypothetical protein
VAEESLIGSLRRFYLLKRLDAARVLDDALSAVWQAKQEAEPGTTLPGTFPHAEALAACGYTTIEDLNGAGTVELQDAGLNTSETQAVLSALAALL